METLAERLEFSGPAMAGQEEEPLQPGVLEVGKVAIVLRETLPPWVPSRMRLGSLRDSRLRIVEALDVLISQEEGQVVAEATELNEFGWGANLGEAITDLQRAVAELYFELEAEQQRLGAGLKAVWRTLESKIRKK